MVFVSGRAATDGARLNLEARALAAGSGVKVERRGKKGRWPRRGDGSGFSRQVPSLKELALSAMLLIAMNADLFEAAKALPLPERMELAEALWESITGEGHEPPFTPAQADELDRRLGEHRAGPRDGNSWGQVK